MRCFVLALFTVCVSHSMGKKIKVRHTLTKLYRLTSHQIHHEFRSPEFYTHLVCLCIFIHLHFSASFRHSTPQQTYPTSPNRQHSIQMVLVYDQEKKTKNVSNKINNTLIGRLNWGLAKQPWLVQRNEQKSVEGDGCKCILSILALEMVTSRRFKWIPNENRGHGILWGNCHPLPPLAAPVNG